MNNRASFRMIVADELGDVIYILDDCETVGGMSVTNDAEAVVERALSEHGNRRIVYRDTNGSWDELKHDGRQFTGFAPLPPKEQAECRKHFP